MLVPASRRRAKCTRLPATGAVHAVWWDATRPRPFSARKNSSSCLGSLPTIALVSHLRKCETIGVSQSADLSPTLWRTFRVLANPTRLGILDFLCSSPPSSVEGIAAACNITESKASEHLRALHSRGLLAVQRISRYAFYRHLADPSVRHAGAILGLCRAASGRGDAISDRLQSLTAFTHARRIAIVQELVHAPAGIEHLVNRCNISHQALFRHLDKLRRRGVIEQADDGNYRLATLRAGFLSDLVGVVGRG